MRQHENLLTLSGSDEDSDPEDSIHAIHPEEQRVPAQLVMNKDDESSPFIRNARHILEDFRKGTAWWVQFSTIYFAAVLTYSYTNSRTSNSNVQISIMTVITLIGASPLCGTHLTTAAIGTFVGGQNIIGSTGLETLGATDINLVSYLCLLWLSLIVSWIWSYVMNSSLRILDGCAGRLGTTTFFGMNVVMLTVWGPLQVVDWNRYYYGLVHVIHVAEEDSSAQLASAWSWTEEAELAIGYVLAVLWLGLVAGATRIFHHRYVQQWHQNKSSLDSPNLSQPPAPLNNILVPVLLSLLSILVVNATQYRHAPGLYNGFAVGAYVAMASLQKIPTVFKFFTVSIVAAGWGLTLTPFFVGFAGKSGFTSMLGHVTHIAIETLIVQLRQKRRRQQQQRQRQQQQQQSQVQPRLTESQSSQLQQEEVNIQKSPQLSQEPQQPQQLSPSHHHSRKHHKPKEAFYTKQQRRQQQRLQHQQQQLEPQKQPQQQTTPLHHRAWSAEPKAGDGVWQHPLEEDDENENHVV
uniref:Uncharacterized protein n=1 Tax=Ditylum brightwellii TaxID=49249 RepID=A0A7S1YP99_9STRA|mmetsp:Transcript_11283/g.16804  ORF Transcript_11283/g.16804 Transcript_11283/m.16804 type:complete len:520 (+) Transcript_11283:89-1648(+)